MLSKTMNTRDLGGYPTDSGRITTYRKFIRSDVPFEVLNQDIEILLNNSINTVIDLRNNEEVARKPCALKSVNQFQYYHYKIYGNGRIPTNVKDVPYSYFEMIDEQKLMLPIMKKLSTVKGGVIYHCTAGKDRTGVISALLLALAGVQKVDILADYQISHAYLDSMIREFCKNNLDIPAYIITPKIEYMEAFLEMFYDKYNSVEEYLLCIGLDDNHIINLKQKLVD